MFRAILPAALIFLASCAMNPSVPENVRAEMAPGGVLRASVNYGNPVIAQRNPEGGAPRGVGPELARELAKRLGARIEYVEFDTAGKIADAIRQGKVDVAFLANDPQRANEIAFSAPYVQTEGTYMVPAGSRMRRIEDLDQKGVKVAVGDKTAYDLYLTRALKNAELVKAPTSPAAIALFRERKLDAVAGVKSPLMAFAAKDPSYRVIDGNFMVIAQASGVPKQREASARYLRDFIEEMKASGFVARALKDSGVADATVSPPANK
jgi:polar amino acid transport system substrate-binding protein